MALTNYTGTVVELKLTYGLDGHMYQIWLRLGYQHNSVWWTPGRTGIVKNIINRPFLRSFSILSAPSQHIVCGVFESVTKSTRIGYKQNTRAFRVFQLPLRSTSKILSILGSMDLHLKDFIPVHNPACASTLSLHMVCALFDNTDLKKLPNL